MISMVNGQSGLKLHLRYSYRGMTERIPARIETWFFIPPALALILLVVIRFTHVEIPVFEWLNRQGQYANDYLWLGLTIFGDGLVVSILILPFLRRWPSFAWSMILASIFMALWIKSIKYLLVTRRPLSILPPDRFHLIGAPYRFNSFPSGHATTAAVLAVTVCIFCRRTWVRAGVIVLALAIGFSRIAMGVHWPTDVLVGFAGGWLSGLFAFWISQRFTVGRHPAVRIFVGTILFGLAVRMLFINHTDYPQASILLKAIAMACLSFTIVDVGVAQFKKRTTLQPGSKPDPTITQ